MTDTPSYELFEELGRGENTIVYRGYDLNLSRDVAIKELDEASRKDERRAHQFLKEASFLAQFEHENVLRIYSVDKQRGWIVMEPMKGTLANQIVRQPMPADTVRSVLRQILGALDFLHQKNKVHGAVRPSNILINDQGTVKLSDFEAATQEGELRAPTGSKKHLAPELIRPEFGDFGPTVDLYCLGFTALELLAGPRFDSLFPGTGAGAIDADVAWLRWHSSEEELQSVGQLCPGVPEDLANVINKLLSKQAADRPQTAKEVLAMLSEQAFVPVIVQEQNQTGSVTAASLATATSAAGKSPVRVIGGKSMSAPAPAAGKRKSKRAATAPLSAKDRANEFLGKPYVLWPLCAAMLLGALGIGIVMNREGEVVDPEATNTRLPIAQIEPVFSDVIVSISPPDALLELSEDLTEQVRGASQPTGGALKFQLAEGTPLVLTASKQGFEPKTVSLDYDSLKQQNFQVAVSLDQLPVLPPQPKLVSVAVTVSPADAELKVASELGSEIERVSSADGDEATFRFSLVEGTPLELKASQEGFEPESVSIAYKDLAEQKFEIAMLLKQTPLPTDLAKDGGTDSEIDPGLNEGDGDVDGIDDTLVGLFEGAEGEEADPDKTAELAGQFTGKAELVIDTGAFIEEVSDVSFSPDGRLIAAAGGKVVRIWDIESGDLIATLRGDRSRTSYGNCYAAEFSPDGKTLLVGINDYKSHGSIREYSTDNFKEIKRLIPGHTAPCRKIAFSGSGKRRISADADGNLMIVESDTDKSIGLIEAANPDKPIFDVIAFPDAREDLILTIDFSGPKVYSPAGQMLGPQDKMPDEVRGWFVDVVGQRVEYPFGTTKDPRQLDFAFDRGIWAAAGVGYEGGRNHFWAAIFPARDGKDAGTKSKPLTTYSGHRWSITSLEIGPGDKLAASADLFGEVHIWDRNTGELVRKLKGIGKSIYEVAFDENSNRIAFGTTPFKPDAWARNHFGDPEKVLDLRQRAILPLNAADDLKLNNERPQIGSSAVDVSKAKGDASFHVNLKRGGNTVSQYRISSGRSPTVFSLLGAEKLGVAEPVIFGDDEGMLALWDSSGDELKRAFIGHGSQVSGVSISRNGKLLVSASTDRTIRIWSLEDHTPTGIFDFKFENTSVYKVVPGSSSEKAGVRVGDEIVSLDGMSITDMYNRMLEGKFDYRPGQVVPVRMKRDGKEFEYKMTMAEGYDFVDPTLNFFVGDDDQWIIWSPRGYYDASPGADRLIGWHVNRGPEKSANFYEVQQFREQLYRPDVINRILDGESVDDAVRLANEERKTIAKGPHDFRSPDEIAQFHPPSVTILVPSGPTQTEADKLTIAARVESPNGLSIREVTLLRNGNVLKVFRPESGNGPVYDVTHEVPLVPGENQLEIIASNGQASSAAVGIAVERIAAQAKAVADAYVLAVGVSSYQNAGSGLNELQFAAKDAESFADAVRNQQGGKLYRQVTTRVLSDSEATRTNILDGFQWLVDRVKPNDSVIVFFSGHAFVDSRDNFYLATHEVETDRPRATAVSWREFTRMLHEDLPPCKRIVFLDARPTEDGIRPGMRNPLLDLAIPELGTTFFASNTLQQSSAEVLGSDHGAFMQAIVDTMKDKRADRMPNPPDQLLNPVELARGIRTRVEKASDGRQIPTYFAAAPLRHDNLLEQQLDVRDPNQ